MMTGGKVRLLLSTYRVYCGCRVAGLQTSARPQQKHLSKARQKAKEDRRDGDTSSVELDYRWQSLFIQSKEVEYFPLSQSSDSRGLLEVRVI